MRYLPQESALYTFWRLQGDWRRGSARSRSATQLSRLLTNDDVLDRYIMPYSRERIGHSAG